jgi:valyl-tRNA synthetase
MPHLTEEIWSSFKKNYLIDEEWPVEITTTDSESNQIEHLKALISQIRNFRTNYKISNKIILEIYTSGNMPEWFLLQLQEIAKVKVINSKNSNLNSKVVFSTQNISLEINAEEYIDIDFELNRLNKKINELEKSRNISEQRLQNVNFVNNANQELIDKEKINLETLTEEIILIKATIKNLTI